MSILGGLFQLLSGGHPQAQAQAHPQQASQSQVQYVGPYSPEAYNAANMIRGGGAGAPYNANIIAAGHQIINSQPQGGGGGLQVRPVITPNINGVRPGSSPFIDSQPTAANPQMLPYGVNGFQNALHGYQVQGNPNANLGPSMRSGQLQGAQSISPFQQLMQR